MSYETRVKERSLELEKRKEKNILYPLSEIKEAVFRLSAKDKELSALVESLQKGKANELSKSGALVERGGNVFLDLKKLKELTGKKEAPKFLERLFFKK